MKINVFKHIFDNVFQHIFDNVFKHIFDKAFRYLRLLQIRKQKNEIRVCVFLCM